jgi:hypothetical protein
MTVCITGDVHHMSLGTRDQEYLDVTEVEAAIEYAGIAAEYDVPVTLFVTGKAAVEEPDRVQRLAAMDTVEIGGHNYWAFGTPLHKAFKGLLGTWNGPRVFQSWEIGKTVDAFSELGVAITSWRDHAYRHDSNTASLLAEHGLTHFSDAVGPDERVRRRDGVTVVPINTPPDHEHLYHAFRTPEFVAEGEFVGPFGAESRDPDGWLDWVLEAVDERRTEGEPATVLAHPACMALGDDLSAFERLCEFVSTEHDAARVSDVGHD